MHPRIQEIVSYLETQRAALARAFAAVPVEARERRPAPERWSAAEVVGHLAVVEGRITQVLQAGIESARAAGLERERDTSAVVPTLNTAGVLDRRRGLTASAAAQPPAGVTAGAAWGSLEASRSGLLRLIHSADGLALGQVSAPSPVLGTLNGYQWLVFVGAHEARHAAQIDEIAGALAS